MSASPLARTDDAVAKALLSLLAITVLLNPKSWMGALALAILIGVAREIRKRVWSARFFRNPDLLLAAPLKKSPTPGEKLLIGGALLDENDDTSDQRNKEESAENLWTTPQFRLLLGAIAAGGAFCCYRFNLMKGLPALLFPLSVAAFAGVLLFSHLFRPLFLAGLSCLLVCAQTENQYPFLILAFSGLASILAEIQKSRMEAAETGTWDFGAKKSRALWRSTVRKESLLLAALLLFSLWVIPPKPAELPESAGGRGALREQRQTNPQPSKGNQTPEQTSTQERNRLEDPQGSGNRFGSGQGGGTKNGVGSRSAQTPAKPHPQIPEISPELLRVIFFTLALGFVVFLLSRVRSSLRKNDPKQVQAARPDLRKLRREARKELELLEKSLPQLDADQEIIRRYAVFLKMMELSPAPREESLPPTDYQIRLQALYPILRHELACLTDGFCDVAYGKKKTSPTELNHYRRAFKSVEKFFL